MAEQREKQFYIDNVVTPKGSFSWPKLREPSAFSNEEPKYSCELLIEKTDENKATIGKFLAKVKECAQGKWGGGIKMSSVDMPIRDGDKAADKYDQDMREEGNTDKVGKRDYQRGHYVLKSSARKDKQPLFYGPGGSSHIIDAEDIVAGNIGRFVVNLGSYKLNGRKGVSASLRGVQKLEEGTPIAGGTPIDASLLDDELSDSSLVEEEAEADDFDMGVEEGDDDFDFGGEDGDSEDLI